MVPAATTSDNTLVAVHVAGAVAHPGVVWIIDGSLTAQAIDLAGGALPSADLDQINLAAPLSAGDQIEVPDRSGSPSESNADSDGLIDINRADASELQTLPGVGPVLAERIVAHRESVGGFESVEDLLDVSGIGETILASLRDFISPP
jgi:competence protein ComEA